MGSRQDKSALPRIPSRYLEKGERPPDHATTNTLLVISPRPNVTGLPMPSNNPDYPPCCYRQPNPSMKDCRRGCVKRCMFNTAACNHHLAERGRLALNTGDSPSPLFFLAAVRSESITSAANPYPAISGCLGREQHHSNCLDQLD